MISADKPTSSYATGYVAVQLTSITTSVVDPFIPVGTPRLEVTAGGQGAPFSTYQIPRIQARLITPTRFYTRIFAINDKKVDAQATTVQIPRDSKSVYDLFNVGLHNDETNQSRITASLVYDGKIASL